jgi:predicted RNA binding protein YcfA (HicA-like mRNA interferase family)
VVHQRGSHLFLTDGEHKLTVPRHRAIKRGTLLSIIQQSGLSRQEFIKLLRER